MIKTHLIGIGISLVIILSSCQSKKERDLPERVISVNPEEMIDLDLGETLLQARFISLETTQESLVIYPDKVITAFGGIYILDRRQRALLLFDSDGRFKKKLKTVAKPGPKEIAEISDISINPFDSTISAIGMFYTAKLSPELEVLGKVQQKVGMWHHYWISENKFLYYSNYLNPLNNNIIGLYDYNKQEEDSGILLKDENPGFPFGQPWVFLHTNEGPLICPPLCDTIFQFNKGSLETYRTFDFGKYQISKKIRSQLSVRSFGELKEQRLAFHIIKFFENNNNYMFSYHFMSKHWKYIYFRENEIGYTIKDTYVDQEKFFLRSVGTTKSGELISWFSPDEVKRLEEAQVVTQKLDDITLDSNPVLCFISKIILHEKE
jgi:hypothetical protein